MWSNESAATLHIPGSCRVQVCHVATLGMMGSRVAGRLTGSTFFWTFEAKVSWVWRPENVASFFKGFPAASKGMSPKGFVFNKAVFKCERHSVTSHGSWNYTHINACFPNSIATSISTEVAGNDIGDGVLRKVFTKMLPPSLSADYDDVWLRRKEAMEANGILALHRHAVKLQMPHKFSIRHQVLSGAIQAKPTNFLVHY